jgi:hypothetical protein
LDAIKPKVQQHAARSNNRGFMHLVLGKVVQKREDYVEKDVLPEEIPLNESLDSVDEEIKEMEQALDRNPTVQDASADAGGLSPLID